MQITRSASTSILPAIILIYRMLRHRVIPCLLLRNGGLVKTLKFANPKYIGDPINAIRIFNEKEVDELLVLDIDASKAQREPNYELIDMQKDPHEQKNLYGNPEYRTVLKELQVRMAAIRKETNDRTL